MEALFSLMTILGPLPLAAVLLWGVLQRNSSQSIAYTKKKADSLCDEEEERRRDRTDAL